VNTKPKSAFTSVDVLSLEERRTLYDAFRANADGVMVNPEQRHLPDNSDYAYFAARQLRDYDLGTFRGCVFKINDAGRAVMKELLRDGKYLEPVDADSFRAALLVEHHPECAWAPGNDEMCSCAGRGPVKPKPDLTKSQAKDKKTIEYDPAHDLVFVVRADGSRIVLIPKNDGQDLNETQSKMALLMLAEGDEEAMAWLEARFFPETDAKETH